MVNRRVTGTRSRVIHLINPKTDSLTTRPLYLNRALYSPLAGLLRAADAFEDDAVKARKAGMDGHLAKPYTRDGLREVLMQWL